MIAVRELEPVAIALGQASGLYALLDREPADLDTIRARLDFGPRGASALLTALTALGLLRRARSRYTLTARGRQRWQVACGYARNPLDVGLSWKLASLRHDLPLQAERIQAWAAGRSLPDAAAAARRMHDLMAGPAQQLAQQPLFGRCRRLLDVAGGLGTNLRALAQRWPRLQLGLFELPEVAELARAERPGIDRQPGVAFHAGDMFHDPLPTGYDAHLWSNVFHDWPPERCAQLARRSFAALPRGGRIVLHELLLDDDRRGPVDAALFSLMMLFTTLGQQFSGAELRALLREAGFVRPRVVRGSPYALVSAVRP